MHTIYNWMVKAGGKVSEFFAGTGGAMLIALLLGMLLVIVFWIFIHPEDFYHRIENEDEDEENGEDEDDAE